MKDHRISRRAVLAGSAAAGAYVLTGTPARAEVNWKKYAGTIAFRDGFADAGQRVIIVAGVPLRIPGTTNMLRIATVAGPEKP